MPSGGDRAVAVIALASDERRTPLADGSQPEGFPVKGNADSGLFHEPDGQWYDATEAEFYFKSAEDAEAAGFTRAGEGSDK